MVKKILSIAALAGITLLLGAAVLQNAFPNKTRILHNKIQENSIPVTGPNASDAFVGCPGILVEGLRPDFEQQVVELTNKVRVGQGLGPLKRVVELDEAARYHAADMSHDDYFDHNTFDRGKEGGLVASCDTWQRMESYYKYWNAMGENIAAGQRSPEMALDGWMNSPDHYHNMVSDSYWEMGSGFYEGDGGFRYYWDQNFGRRSDRYPVIINNEAAQTTSQNVNLYIYGDWKEMRLRVDDGPWSKWTDFEREFPILLPDVVGEHTVYLEMRTQVHSSRSNDTIELVKPEGSVIGRLLSPFFQTP